MRSVALTALTAMLALSSACQADSGEWVAYDDLGFRVPALADWSAEREPRRVVFSGDSEAYGERVTITVLSSKLITPDRDDQKVEDVVFEATVKVLRAMPDVDMAKPVFGHERRMPAGYFRLSFQPKGKDGRYDRHHVVLLGSKRVFHIVHTAPAGELSASASVFEDVVQNLREII